MYMAHYYHISFWLVMSEVLLLSYSLNYFGVVVVVVDVASAGAAVGALSVVSCVSLRFSMPLPSVNHALPSVPSTGE